MAHHPQHKHSYETHAPHAVAVALAVTFLSLVVLRKSASTSLTYGLSLGFVSLFYMVKFGHRF